VMCPCAGYGTHTACGLEVAPREPIDLALFWLQVLLRERFGSRDYYELALLLLTRANLARALQVSM
jgi:hypothetical protein